MLTRYYVSVAQDGSGYIGITPEEAKAICAARGHEHDHMEQWDYSRQVMAHFASPSPPEPAKLLREEHMDRAKLVYGYL